MSKPFISVMVLCYNYANLLPKTLNAIAAQTFRDFELVMINNDSTDNTEEVYKSFIEEHKDIKTAYIHVSPNKGPIHGWNEAFAYANGEYILMNDADDWMEPECLKKLAEVAKATGADRVMGSYQEVLPDGTITRRRIHKSKNITLPIGTLQGVILRRSIINENNIRIPEEPYTIAYDQWMIFNFAVVEKNRGISIPDIVYNYFYNPASITQTMELQGQIKKDFNVGFGPYVDNTKEAIRKTDDFELKAEMEYLLLRAYYAQIYKYFKNLQKEEAYNAYAMMHNKLKSEFPLYLNNNKLFPFRNGYELSGSLACWIISMLERGNLINLLTILAKFNSKNIRRTVVNDGKSK